MQGGLEEFGIGFCSHASKCVVAPGRNFSLHKNAVSVAVFENSLILRPMNTRKHAVQMFQVVMMVRDPLAGLRHSNFRIAPRPALDSHQTNALTVQLKPAAFSLHFPDP